MTTYQSPLVVGIFQDELQAKSAVDTLRSAGFRYDQVGVAISSSNNATRDLQADLMSLGVSQEQASYYDSEYKSGHIVVSVRPDGRDPEVLDIMHGNGAYNYETLESSASPAPTDSDTAEDNAASQADKREEGDA